MSWWKTVLGGTLGFMIGGPLGAMLGVAFAGNISRRSSSFGGSSGNYGPGNQQRVQAAFFSSVFSVMGYIAKVDGKVSKSEIIMDQSGPTILVTGGAGYIGTHCIFELLQQDYNVVAIDNFNNAVKGDVGRSLKFVDGH